MILIATIVATAIFMSCSKNGNEVLNSTESVESMLNVRTTFAVPETRADISSFPDRACIGLFITSGSLGNSYNGVANYVNVKSQYNRGSNAWSQTPPVYLTPALATIYAYYPYSESVRTGNIPIDHLSQLDYLYGTHSNGQGTVNSEYPTVSLTMRHALALLQFNINRSNYEGVGVVTKIEVANAIGKTCIFSQGTLNIQTGGIALTSGENDPAFISNSSGLYTIPQSSTSVESPLRILILPTESIPGAGDVKVNFTIDGKIYTWDVPASTVWNSGTKNIYSVSLSGRELVVSGVTIVNWTDGISGSVTLR